ncbi:hypothetical protein F5Y01DRAFT_42609 [Xylaria sp. FL0043]|nr:hypothetical protein F5Y01DRAFT_42609 [Xylaria sp. FL0043]
MAMGSGPSKPVVWRLWFNFLGFFDLGVRVSCTRAGVHGKRRGVGGTRAPDGQKPRGAGAVRRPGACQKAFAGTVALKEKKKRDIFPWLAGRTKDCCNWQAAGKRLVKQKGPLAIQSNSAHCPRKEKRVK